MAHISPPVTFRDEVKHLDQRMSSQSQCDELSFVDSALGTMSLQKSSIPQSRTAEDVEVSRIAEHDSLPVDPAEPTSDAPRAQTLSVPSNNLFANVIHRAMDHPDALRPVDAGESISEETLSPEDTVPLNTPPSVDTGPFEENTHLHNYACCGDSTYLLAPFRAVLAEQNDDGDSSLHLSIINGQVPVVHQITTVWHGQPQYLNIQNNLGQTGMHVALLTGQPRIVERLLAAGADPTKRDRNGDTCLHLAAKFGDKMSAGCILYACQKHNLRKPTLEARNYAGLTAVHLCVQFNRRDMLRDLVMQWGADVDAQDFTSGKAPLHMAVESGRLSTASMLAFDLQANVDALTYDNHTALHLAAGRQHRGMVALLVAAGARTDLVDGEGEQAADLTYDTQILRLCNA